MRVIETKGEGFREVTGGPKCQMLQSDQVKERCEKCPLDLAMSKTPQSDRGCGGYFYVSYWLVYGCPVV